MGVDFGTHMIASKCSENYRVALN